MSRPRVRQFERIRVWLYHRLPPGLLWHPGEWLLAFMCAFSGAVTLATGIRSDSLDSLLPDPAYRAYGAFLVVGAWALVRGLTSIRWVGFDRYVVTRVPAYRLGLRLLGFNVSLYVVAVVLNNGPTAIPATIIPLAFIGMCAVRLIALGGPDDRSVEDLGGQDDDRSS